MQLSRFAAQSVKVVLSGQGADEPHGGYGRHQAALGLAFLRHVPASPLVRAAALAPRVEKAAQIARLAGRIGDDERLVRLVDYLFERFEKLQKEPGYHEKWKDVNLAANVPGWERFKPLQEKLDKVSAANAPRPVNTTQLRAQTQKAAPYNPTEQERLFQQFLEWNRKQGGP